MTTSQNTLGAPAPSPSARLLGRAARSTRHTVAGLPGSGQCGGWSLWSLPYTDADPGRRVLRLAAHYARRYCERHASGWGGGVASRRESQGGAPSAWDAPRHLRALSPVDCEEVAAIYRAALGEALAVEGAGALRGARLGSALCAASSAARRWIYSGNVGGADHGEEVSVNAGDDAARAALREMQAGAGAIMGGRPIVGASAGSALAVRVGGRWALVGERRAVVDDVAPASGAPILRTVHDPGEALAVLQARALAYWSTPRPGKSAPSRKWRAGYAADLELIGAARSAYQGAGVPAEWSALPRPAGRPDSAPDRLRQRFSQFAARQRAGAQILARIGGESALGLPDRAAREAARREAEAARVAALCGRVVADTGAPAGFGSPVLPPSFDLPGAAAPRWAGAVNLAHGARVFPGAVLGVNPRGGWAIWTGARVAHRAPWHPVADPRTVAAVKSAAAARSGAASAGERAASAALAVEAVAIQSRARRVRLARALAVAGWGIAGADSLAVMAARRRAGARAGQSAAQYCAARITAMLRSAPSPRWAAALCGAALAA